MNSPSEFKEKTSSSTDLHKESDSVFKVSLTTTNKNNTDNTNASCLRKNIVVDAKNSTLKNLTSFSQIVYQSRVKHFVSAVENNCHSSNDVETATLVNAKSEETASANHLNANSNKLIGKLNNGANSAASNSYRLNLVKPKQSVTSHFVQRPNEVEYQTEKRLYF